MLDHLRHFKHWLERGVSRRLSLPVQRFRLAFSYYRQPLLHLLRWLRDSRELTNFTYDLHPRSEAYLASLIALVSRRPLDEIEGYFREIHDDTKLLAELSELARQAPPTEGIDPQIHFGRRVGWYALARALKPKVIVETGVDKGLGTCALAAALSRNAREGKAGFVYATDLNPRAGYFFRGELQRHGKILYGDSIESLRALPEKIDLFINDSDHSADYEAAEYRTVAEKLSANAVLIGDNSHVTGELLNFARATRRAFLFFREEPLDHWYPGGGMGVAFPTQNL